MRARGPYINDARTREARKRGYPARSVFKLEEIDRRFRVLRSGLRVLDLGCAPGSWSLYAAKKAGATGVVVGIDLQACDLQPREGLVLVQGDAFELEAPLLREKTDGRCPPFDVVLSDMAPRTTGIKSADHAASIDLCDRALFVAGEQLVEGGALVVKVFEGPEREAFEDRVRQQFEDLRRLRPRGTRSRSVEVFVVARGRRMA